MPTSRYLVAGLGKTGLSIAHYLRRQQQPFAVFDTRATPPGLAAFQAEFPEVTVFLGEFPDALCDQLQAIIMSPGVASDEPSIKKAIVKGVPLWGDIECFAREVTAPVIAITGTNGKSTVTTLVGEMAAEAGLRVAVGGNIGTPVLDLLDTPYDLWVLELSSFQLALTESLAPVAATILNVTPDHLDRHHTLEAYLQAKQRIYHHAKALVYNRQDELTLPPVEKNQEVNSVISYGLDEPSRGQWGILLVDGSYWIALGSEKIFCLDKLRVKGRHNWQNALAACALAEIAGVPRGAMVNVLQRFSGLMHRTQWVRTLNDVEWIDDSKGTNIGATTSAILGIGGSVSGKIVLIAGGQGKGADFTELRAPVTEYVRSVVLLGEDAEKMACALADVVPVTRVSSLQAAVNMAKSQAIPGDVVLLSPACASLDMFQDYKHRGEVFATAVNAL